MARRFLAQRALTRQWLNTDLPVSVEQGPSWELTGVGSLTLRMEPETPGRHGHRVLADDGRELFEEWGTLIYLESAGTIRGGFIVIQSTFDGEAWIIECASFSTYPHGVPFDGAEYMRSQIDPAQVVRDLWAHVQSHPDSDLGVVVSGSTPIRVGTTTTARRRAAEADVKAQQEVIKTREAALKTARDAKSAGLKVKQAAMRHKQMIYKTVKQAALKRKQAAYKAQQAAYKALQAAKKSGTGVPAAQAAYNAAKATYATRTAEYKTASLEYKAEEARYADAVAAYEVIADAVEAPRAALAAAKDRLSVLKDRVSDLKDLESEDGGAILFQWWENQDCGEEIQEFADRVPFDLVETHRWASPEKLEVSHRVEVHYPRAGRRRTDLAFVQGVNVIDYDAPERRGDEFANAILGLGAGEGAGAVRAATAVRDGRLRRVRTVEARNVRDRKRLSETIRAELTRARKLVEISSITVMDHANARIGSWSLGDDIEIRAVFPHLGDVAIWHRIVGWEYVTEDTAKLSLRRSDTFSYGG